MIPGSLMISKSNAWMISLRPLLALIPSEDKFLPTINFSYFRYHANNQPSKFWAYWTWGQVIFEAFQSHMVPMEYLGTKQLKWFIL